MGPAYVLFIGEDRQCFFELHGPDGALLLQSRGYRLKFAAEIGIEGVRLNAPHLQRYMRREGGFETYWFSLHTRDGEMLGRSPIYRSVQIRNEQIEVMRRCANWAPVEDRVLRAA